MLGSAARGVEQGRGRACEVLGLQWAHVGPVWAVPGCGGELCRVWAPSGLVWGPSGLEGGLGWGSYSKSRWG